MAVRDIYLKIEHLRLLAGRAGRSCDAADRVPPRLHAQHGPRGRHDPVDEVNARRLTALIYREYLDSHFLVPKPDKLIAADVNEPAYTRRVPGTVIYAHPGRRSSHPRQERRHHASQLSPARLAVRHRLRRIVAVRHAEHRRPPVGRNLPRSNLDVHLRRRPRRCVGAWPFHDHCRDIGAFIDRGLFGGMVVLPEKDMRRPAEVPAPRRLLRASSARRSTKASRRNIGECTTGLAAGTKCRSAHRPAVPMPPWASCQAPQVDPPRDEPQRAHAGSPGRVAGDDRPMPMPMPMAGMGGDGPRHGSRRRARGARCRTWSRWTSSRMRRSRSRITSTRCTCRSSSTDERDARARRCSRVRRSTPAQSLRVTGLLARGHLRLHLRHPRAVDERARSPCRPAVRASSMLRLATSSSRPPNVVVGVGGQVVWTNNGSKPAQRRRAGRREPALLLFQRPIVHRQHADDRGACRAADPLVRVQPRPRA